MRNAESAARAIGKMADQTRSVLQELCGHLDKDVAVLQRIIRREIAAPAFGRAADQIRSVLQKLRGNLGKDMVALQHVPNDDDYRIFDGGNAIVDAREASAASMLGRMADQTRSMLRRLCGRLDRAVMVLQRVVQGRVDYRKLDHKDQAVVARAAAVAVTLKQIAETPLLEEDGSVTDAIRKTVRKAKKFLKQLEAM